MDSCGFVSLKSIDYTTFYNELNLSPNSKSSMFGPRRVVERGSGGFSLLFKILNISSEAQPPYDESVFLLPPDQTSLQKEYSYTQQFLHSIFGNSSDSFLQMCNERGIDNHDFRFIISKLSTIIIRTTYYIFCKTNKA